MRQQLELQEAFQARTDRLFRELKRAIKWDRPSILIAIYSSEYVRLEAENMLKERLREELDQDVEHFQVSEKKFDVPLLISQFPNREKTVFFVDGLRWGGGKDNLKAYKALNIRREYFVDYQFRVVFWLAEREAIALPQHAPDFWAFRHRVVEFLEEPKPEQIIPAVRELTWRGFADGTITENTEAKIELRQALLDDLPDKDESLSTRVELLNSLGALYWVDKSYQKSIDLAKKAIKLTRQLENERLAAGSYFLLGLVYQSLGRYKDAIVAFQKAIHIVPDVSYSYDYLARVYNDLDRYE